MWSAYSKLNPTLILNNNVNINKYSKLIAYLKHKSVRHKQKTSITLTRDEVINFLVKAPDGKYLIMNVK